MRTLWVLAAVVAGNEPRDLLSQEISALEEVIGAAQQKVEVLKGIQGELKRGASGALGHGAVALLTAPLPPVESLPVRAHSSADDAAYLAGRIRAPHGIRQVKILPLRSTGPAGGLQVPAFVVAAHDSGLLVYTPSGSLVAEHALEEAPELIAPSPSLGTEDLFLLVLSKGQLTKLSVKARAHRLTTKEKEQRKSDGRSSYLVPEANVTLSTAWTVPIDVQGVTSVQAISSRGQKYIVLGDASGALHLVASNGTTLGTTPATDDADGVLALGYVTQLLYRSSRGFGIFSPEEQVAFRPCAPFAEIVSAIQGVGPGSRVFVHADGAVRAFGTQGRTACTKEWTLPLEPVDLFPVKGFLLGVTREPAGEERRLFAMNISNSAASIHFEREIGKVVQWDAFRRTAGGGLLATLASDQRTIEVWDLLLTDKPSSGGGGSFLGGALGGADGAESLTNMKIPIFAVAMLLVIGYQYMKFKSPSSGKKGRGLADLKSLAKKRA